MHGVPHLFTRDELGQNGRALWDAAGALGFQDTLWSERAADVRRAGGLLQ
jgi:hypothetical protein